MSGEEDFARIEARHAEILARLGHAGADPRLPRVRDDMGAPHIERHDDRWHYVATERGRELERTVYESDEDLLYRWLKDGLFWESWDYELARRVEGQDSRCIAFARQIEQMGRVSPEWRARLQAELDAVLAKHPYHDEAPAPTAAQPTRNWPAHLMMLALGLLWLAAHYPLYAAWRDSHRLDSVGVQTTARVTNASISYPKAGRTYTVDYEFTVDGIEYAGDQSVDRGTFELLEEGGPISITYDPAAPSTNRIGVAVDEVVELGTYYVIADLLILIVVIGGLRKLPRQARETA